MFSILSWALVYYIFMGLLDPIEANSVDLSSTNAFDRITPSKSLNWVPCFSDKNIAPFTAVECARLIAPLDYSNATAGEALLAVIRFRTQANASFAEETFPVFFNPGGPGGDPVEEFLSGAAASVWTNYAPNNDIIGVVPRAVGSTFPPAGCYLDQKSRVARLRKLAFNNELGYVNASLNIMDANAVAFGLDCASVSADVLRHMGTVSTAKDMNHVLKMLGQGKLAFVGYSYGTVLGATFAALFPEKVERMVLDGVADSNDWFANAAAPERSVGDVNIALDSFFTSCFAAGPEKCPIWAPEGPSKIRSYFFEADRRIQQRPINVPQVGLFEYPQWRYAAYGSLFQPTLLFRNLAKLTAEVYEGSAGDAMSATLQAQANSGMPADPPLTEPGSGLSNGIESLWTIRCLDRGLLQASNSTEEPGSIFEAYRSVSELGRNNAYYEIICERFPIISADELPCNRTARFENIRTQKPILFVGNTADATTPLRNALSMAKVFPNSTVLVINGTGHTSRFADPALSCVRQWIAPYIAHGALPPNGTVCEGSNQPFDVLEADA